MIAEEEDKTRLFLPSHTEVWASLNITIFAHPLHSVTPGNQDGTGRYGSLWSPHSLHGHCRNPVYKRLHTQRGLNIVKHLRESVNV